jgi:hypothetical protein
VYCGECGSPLDRPGDYCLVCRSPNADAVVVDCGPDRTTLTVLDDDEAVGETTVTTTPEDDPETERRQVRNYAGRVADEVRRKRPEAVFVAGDRRVVDALRADLHHELKRVPDDDPVGAAVEGRGERSLAVVDAAPAEKLGGTHSTLIGERDGLAAVRTVADHPHVKKVVPGPIEAGGSSPRGGVRAKVTRADGNGNVRMILRDGSSVQENRVVTTAMDRETGERVRADLSEALAAADLDG